MRFISIRWRLVLSYVLLTALTVSVVGALALALIRNNLAEREADLLRVNAQAVARQAAALWQPRLGADRYSLQQLADTAAFLGNAQVRILDRNGDPIVDSGPNSAANRLMWFTRVDRESAVRAQAANQNPWVMLGLLTQGDVVPLDDPILREFLPDLKVYAVQRVPSAYGNQFEFAESPAQVQAAPAVPAVTEAPLPETAARVSVPVLAGGVTLGFVELRSATAFNDETLATAQRALLLAAFGAAVLAIALGLWVSRGLTAPMRQLAAVAGQMGQGDLSVRAPLKNQRTRDEADQLAMQFNGMAEKLEASFAALSTERDALRRFVADASHELRTPITALKMSNELLQGPMGDDSAARAEFLAQNDAQLNRLEWITHNLLDLSRLDAGIASLNLAEHDAGDVMASVAQPFKSMAEHKGITLVIRHSSFVIWCDRARIEIALSNLIDNALKFTPQGGKVTISAEAADDSMRLLVRDTGIGVAEADRAHIFERFYRGGNHRADGTGLGLAIVKSIAQAHGGAAFVESEPGQGSTFGITLPLNPPARS
jgi:signal transduction histidine kinase